MPVSPSYLTNTLQPTLMLSTPVAAQAPAPSPSQPVYQSETATGNTSRATSIGPMPSKQESVLRDIAGLALSYANPVAPGQVHPEQQQVLNAWRNNANSDYGQFMANQGLSMIASNPGVLFNEEMATAQSQWSMEDAKGALSMLGLSAKDWDEYQKLKAQDEARHNNFLMGAVESIAGAVMMFVPGMQYFGGMLLATGVGTMAGGT